MGYCTATDLTSYVLQAYLDAAENRVPGIVSRCLSEVAGEIDDALRSRFVLPLESVPSTLRRIAAVLTAYRVVGAITTVINTQGSTNNEWLPLQTEYKRAVADLKAVREGTMDIGLAELGEEQVEGQGVTVKTRPKIFDDNTWRKF